jgi:prevent-host-death family protein
MYVEELTQIGMKISKTLSISEARKNIFKIADEIQKPDVCYMLTENGKAKAVIMSADEYESWMETMEVMLDFPDLLSEMKEADEEFARGEYVDFEDILKENGMKITNGKIEYVSNRSKKTGK